MGTTLETFVSPLQQLANLRRWNADRDWELPEAAFAAVDVTVATHDSPLMVDVITVDLPAKGAMDGVQRTCDELWRQERRALMF